MVPYIGFSFFPAWINLSIELVAVSSSPVISSEGADVREGIIVQVEGRIVLVPELLSEEIDKPLPRRGLILAEEKPIIDEGLNCCLEFFLWSLIEDLALCVLAHSRGVADHISVFLVQESFDDVRTSVVHKCLASWFHKSVEEGAELIFNELSDVLPMILDIIFQDSGQDRAKGTFIIKTVLVPKLKEIGICALLLYPMQALVNLLVNLNPMWMAEQPNQLLHHRLAISLRWRFIYLRVDDIKFLIESLGLHEHLHEDGVNLAGFSGFVESFDSGDVLFEVMQDMGAHC